MNVLLGEEEVEDMDLLLKYVKGCHFEEDREQFLLAAKHRTHNNGF